VAILPKFIGEAVLEQVGLFCQASGKASVRGVVENAGDSALFCI
jgi:hypothetical protein